ncbi:MAG: tetratricopeptide repeat protein [Anaerolineae bacterium]|nr:tetratricopeptide repeat protein [Anaerolineae bacterium]
MPTPEETTQQAHKAYQKGNFQAAAEHFTAAAEAYKKAGNLALAAEMANNCSVALLQAGNAQGALEAAMGTEKVFQDAGDTSKRAMAFGNQAAAYDALEQLDLAEKNYKKSAEIFQSIGETDLHSQVMKSYSAMLLRSGRQMEALSAMQAGIEHVKKPNLKQRILNSLLKIPFKLLKK